MKRFALLALFLLVTLHARAQDAAAMQAGSSGDRIALRPIDRATVRIVGLFGMNRRVFDSDVTRVRRLFAAPMWAHGSGFFVDSAGIVATAKHVVAGADLVAVFLPGSDVPLHATVVYADPEHDIAFLHVGATAPEVINVPASPRRIEIADPLTGSGFPLDAQQLVPAAFVGVVAREVIDGSLQTSMSINPGNSGGPVVDSHGDLVGLVSLGANVRAGAQGLAWLEPTRRILPGLAIARSSVARTAPVHSEADAVAARIMADFVGTNEEVPLYERTSFELVQRAAATTPSPHAAMLLAAHAWNVHIALLEEREANDLPALSEEERIVASRLRSIAMAMSRRALERAPYLRVSYPVVLSILAQTDRSIVVREGGR